MYGSTFSHPRERATTAPADSFRRSMPAPAPASSAPRADLISLAQKAETVTTAAASEYITDFGALGTSPKQRTLQDPRDAAWHSTTAELSCALPCRLSC